jgi:hypothetical protein
MPSFLHVAAFGAGLLLTLCVCARLTPRAWWRRPNARAAGLLAGGTLAVGAALLALLVLLMPPQAGTMAADQPAPAAADAPVAGARYRAHDALNLRAAGGVDAERLLVVPAGSRLTATGRREGDWWQVRGTVNGATVEGWASSLWLRRVDEG